MQEVKLIHPKTPDIKVIPLTDYYKPEIKEIISKVEEKVSQQFLVSKITKIEYTTSSEATKYHFTA